MKVLVIPDVHLKPYMFRNADILIERGIAENAVCLMDIADDWNQQYNVALYEETYDEAIRFAKKYPNSLWCYGNHDLSYIWQCMETGFSSMASVTVQRKLLELKEALPDDNPIKYVQRIDNVLFSHGGVSDFFVRECVNASLYNNVDSVVDEIAYLVGVALSNAIGEDVGMFIEKNIFEPLHITKYEYGRCSEGYFYGASLMKLTVHDLSQFFLKIMLKRQLQFNK